jgi:ferredoxin-type protein NapH
MIKHKYMILRRLTQIGVLFLYFGASTWGWTVLTGNLSASMFLEKIPLADPFAVLQMFSAGAILASDVIIGAVIITVLYALIGGRAFCSWVCPINMITDAANFLRRKLRMNQVAKKPPVYRSARYWILGLSLILSFLLGVAAFEFISPISMVHRGIVFGLGFGWAAALSVFLFDLFILKNGWCGYVCPLGGFYSTIGRFSLIRVTHDAEKCTECMHCKEVCPEMQVLHMIGKESIPVLSGECTNCARCIEVCNDDALNFHIRTFAKQANKEK